MNQYLANPSDVRSYSIAVDQSGKIEEINQDTVIAFSTTTSSDGFTNSVKIPSKVKRRMFHNHKEKFPSKFRMCLKMFSAAIYVVTNQEIEKISEIVIDKEYEGHNGKIKNHLYNFYQDFGNIGYEDIPDIKFGRVHEVASGNPPRCHTIANQILKGEIEGDTKLDRSFFKAIVLPS